MASMLPNTSSCCECGSVLNITTFEAYLQSIGKTIESLGVFYVDDIAAVREIATDADNIVAWTKGYLTPTDGMPGKYVWQAGNSDADDNGLTTLRPNDYDAADPSTWGRNA